MSVSNTNTNLSLYIPRVFLNVTKERMAEVFHSLMIGKVSSIDFVPREDNNSGDAYNMAFVHFEKFYDNVASTNFQEKVLDTKHEAKVVYDEPWYWICLPNTNPKPDSVRELERRVTELEQWIQYYNSMPNYGFPEPLSTPGTHLWVNSGTQTNQSAVDPSILQNLLPPPPPGDLTRQTATSPISLSPNMNNLEEGLVPSYDPEEIIAENYEAEINAYAYGDWADDDCGGWNFKPPLELPLTEGQIEKDDSGKLYKFKLKNGSPTWDEIPNYSSEWAEANKKFLETHS